MKDDVKISEDSGVLTARICCELDQHTAKLVREKIDRAFFEKMPRLLVLDFSEVGFMDSSGIGLIIGRAEKVGENGATVRVEGLSPTLSRLLRIAGLERVKNLTVVRKERI
jgi:stage II sporulation protein AA (anti-sigma F factor antagonist)